MAKKIYMSGPITGYEKAGREKAFEATKARLQAAGWGKVYNPMTDGLDYYSPHAEHMKKDIRELLKCDAIFMMTGWQASKGCITELAVARACGLQVVNESDL